MDEWAGKWSKPSSPRKIYAIGRVVDQAGAGEDIGQVCGFGDLGIKIETDLPYRVEKETATVMVDFTTP